MTTIMKKRGGKYSVETSCIGRRWDEDWIFCHSPKGKNISHDK